MTFLSKIKNKIKSNLPPIKIAVIYLIIGIGWIIFSDLAILGLSKNQISEFADFQEIKGIAYVLITCVILYLLIRNNFQKLNETNKKLTVNEERYKTFLQQSNEGIFRIELEQPVNINENKNEQLKKIKNNLYLDECNNVFAKYYGLEKNTQLVGFKLNDFMKNSNRNFDFLIKSFIENNYHLNEHDTLKYDKKGNPQYFKNNIVGIVNNNQLIRAWGVTRDITELKKTELALAESEELYRTVVQSLNEGLLITDVKDKIIFASRSMTKITGYELNELVGKIGYKIFFHQKDWDFILNKNKNRYQDLAEMYELEMNRKDGRKIWVSIHGAPYRNSKGEIIGTVGLITDITETKKIERLIKDNEEKYRSVVNSAREVIFQIDDSGKMIFVNPYFLEISGYKINEVIARPFTDFIYEIDKKRIFNEFVSLIYSDKEYLREESRIIKKNNEVRWVEINARLSLNDEGNIKGIAGTLSDIHERKMAAEELVIAKEKAEESDKLKSTFLAQVSHEIRTPLNIILSYNSLIKDEIKHVLTQELEESFDSIEKGGKRLLRTIDLILNMSMVQTGGYNLNIENINLEYLIKQLLIEFKHVAEEKNIKLNFNKNGEECFIQADEYTITQAFQNILDNAIKFTENGKVDICIKPDINGKIVVEIEDTGIGISEDYMPKIFEPFTQEEIGYSRKYEGNGLGLALTKKYLELNNAEIIVNSTKGKGTKFNIRFN